MQAAWLPSALAGLVIGLAFGCEDSGDSLAPPPRILTEQLPDGRVGESYVAVLEVEGNNPPYSFSSEIGVPGLRMEDTGRIVGVPTESGTFGAVVEVRDGSGQGGARTLPLRITTVSEAPIIETTCLQPVSVVPAGGLATVAARLPATPVEASLCGASGDVSQLFVAVDLDEAARVSIEVLSEDGAAQARIVPSTCDDLAAGTCGFQIESQLPAGRHLLLVEGQVGAEIAVILRFGAGSAPRTCDAPAPLEFVNGQATFTVSLDPNSLVPSCWGEGLAVGVAYEFHLDAPADLVVAEQTNAWGLRMMVRSDECVGGPSSECLDVESSNRIIGLTEGTTYYLIILGDASDIGQVGLRLEPPTLRPMNDRCEGALPLDLQQGTPLDVDLDFRATRPENSEECFGEYGLYYRVDLTEPSQLTSRQIDLYGTSTQIQRVSLRTDGSMDCASAEPLSECQDDLCSPDLPAGTYLLTARTSDPTRPPGRLRVERIPAANRTPDNDSCATATALPASASGDLSIPLNYIGATDHDGVDSCGSEYPDLWYAFTLPTGRWQVEVHGNGVRARMLQAACDGQWLTGCDDHHRRVLRQGTYYLAFDHRESRNRYSCESPRPGPARVRVAPAAPEPAGDRCDGAPVVSIGADEARVLTGTTFGAVDDAPLRWCPRESSSEIVGPEVVRQLVLTAPARVRTQVLDGAVTLGIFSTCHGSTAVACGDYRGELDTASPLPIGTYWLHFDGDQTGQAFEVLLRTDSAP